MKSKLYIFLISISFFLYVFLFSNYILITSIGLAFSLYIFLNFLNKLGKDLPIKEMIVLIACAQWIVGAKISYNLGELGQVHHKYFMYVEEYIYMELVVPGLMLLYFGLFLIKSELSLSAVSFCVKNNREQLIKTTRIILLIGLISFVLSRTINISQLSFIFYLANILIYIAVAHFMYLYPKQKNIIFLISIVFTLTLSLQTGLFHNFILVTSFLSFFIFYEGTTFFRKMILISIGFISLYTIQLVKGEYRTIIWESQGNVSAFSAFYNVLEKEFIQNPTHITINLQESDEEEQVNVNSRLNQGWIISKIIDNIPKNQSYLKGETVLEAFEASILPRFLFPNKKGAEQALENFGKLSGIELNKGTSMGPSIIGEFYANYGVLGGWIAMFLYGVFLTLVIKFIISFLGFKSPIILLWFLLFFFQVVKAETELMKIINHLVKSILFFLFLRFILSILNVKLFPSKSAVTDQ